MKTCKFFLVLLTLSFAVNARSVNDFKLLLDNCNMTIEQPPGYVEEPVLANAAMSYDYAIKSTTSDFNLRYSIRPIGLNSYANDSIKKKMEKIKEFRNTQYSITLKTIALNVSGGTLPAIREFDGDAVKQEFNADWGATTFVEVKSDFAPNFKYCMIVAIHKKDVADAYYFYLTNTKETIGEQMQPLFHSLKFKN